MRINDTDKNRFQQTDAENRLLRYPRVSFPPSRRVSVCFTRLASPTLSPGPPCSEEAPRDRPCRWNSRRPEPAVRSRRARGPDSRNDVLVLAAADCRILLRDQRQGGLPRVSWPDHGGVESRLPSAAFRQGAGIGRRLEALTGYEF